MQKSIWVGATLFACATGFRALPSQDASAIPIRNPVVADDQASRLLQRARVARSRHDSALASYEATAKQRLSFFIGVRGTGRDRLAYRHEDAARIYWSRKSRTYVELLGSRSFVGAISGNFGSASDRDLANFIPLPYFPGRDRLWTGDGLITDFIGPAGTVQDSVNPRQLVHPLAHGAEKYYEYSIGDSLQITLPGARRLLLRELRIVARRPQWNLIVGSFWFDNETADLVRAVYRLSSPTDIGAVTRERRDRQSPPRALTAIVGPMRYDISAVSIEYALVNERFWLPRLQTVDGTATAGPTTARLQIEQRFEYARALGTELRTRGDTTVPVTGPDARTRECAETGSRIVVSKRYANSTDVVTSVPCDRVRLAKSPELPASIFADNEEQFDSAARQQMLKALSLRLQSAWSPRSAVFDFGLPQSRYNRVEGLSSGIVAHSELGRGFVASGTLRLSIADRQANGALSLSRSNGRTTAAATLYHRLDASNDWGAPLSFGASVPSLLWGRDEGAYYRTSGVEITARTFRWGGSNWRFFAETQRLANVETFWSIFGDSARVLPNPVADRATQFGVSTRMRYQFGRDPRHLRFSTDVRPEAAMGSYRYLRLLTEATASRSIVGRVEGAITAAVGASAGDLPTQRHFYVGGTGTIRGQRALTASGDAMWMTRTETGIRLGVVRPSVFGDIGWAGARGEWRKRTRPLSGVGSGVSVFDGLLRFDLARGLYPRKQWRVDFSLDSRF